LKDLFRKYLACDLCPRNCKVNRLKGIKGFCGEGFQLRVAYVGPHFGEEPPITGKRGSVTVFLTGCSLRCSFCQNWQISHKGMGRRMGIKELLVKIDKMIEKRKVHNINFVTPDHFIPHIILAIQMIKRKWLDIPVVFNTSGYQSVEVLKQLKKHVDIYLPDFKYADKKLAARLSSCPDYTNIALDAISEMIRQKGFLETKDSIARKGVLVRHLIIPGMIKNSINALSILYGEFGKGLPISLMSQYRPVIPQKIPDLNRSLREEEFSEVYDHALSLGFEQIFVQFMDNFQGDSPFLPDFRLDQPFKGNIGSDN